MLALSLALAGCTKEPPAPAAPLAKPSAETLELGRKVYNFRCYFCHGYSGDAKTLASTYLEPRPRDFHATALDDLPRERMLESVRNGRPGTAMKGFADILKPHEIAAVTDFVRQEFMVSKARNTAYHTAENGWADHERYAGAFPFATGKITLDTPPDQLTPDQRAGRRLFMSACVSCHDRAKVDNEGAPWDSRPLSYPRNGFVPGDWPPQQVDGIASATPYHLHDKIPKIDGLTPAEKRGETLFQQNCAFCHAADGTSRNWIGSFLEPHPRDLTAPAFMTGMTRDRLAGVIREGLPGTSMPAWKSVLSDADIQALIAYISKAFHPVKDDAASASASTAAAAK
jgi:cytochrome c oxidase cbb3-type subunit III